MANSKTKTDQATPSYLQKLERQERSRRLRRYGIIALVAGVATASVLAVPYFKSQKTTDESWKYHEVTATELTDQQANEILSEKNSALVVKFPGESTADTLYSYPQYEDLLYRRQIFAVDVFASDQALLEEEDTDSEASETEDFTNEFGIQLRGQRIAGKRLRVDVSNYQPSVTYTLELGNGEVIDLKGNAMVMYDEAGAYTLRLRAVGPKTPNRVYATYPLNIAEATPQEKEEAKVLAEELAAERQAQIEAEAQAENEKALASTDAPASTSSSPSFEATEIEPVAEEVASKAVAESAPEPTASKPFFASSKMPSFPGGDRALRRYIRRNVDPPRDVANPQNGSVDVRFVVSESGEVESARIIRGLGPEYDAEVLRLVREMPRWEPGEQNGRNVPVYQSLRVAFRFEN